MDAFEWAAAGVGLYLLLSNSLALTKILRELSFTTQAQRDLLNELQQLHGTLQGMSVDLGDVGDRVKNHFSTALEDRLRDDGP